MAKLKKAVKKLVQKKKPSRVVTEAASFPELPAKFDIVCGSVFGALSCKREKGHDGSHKDATVTWSR
jgi:hypothetical protein